MNLSLKLLLQKSQNPPKYFHENVTRNMSKAISTTQPNYDKLQQIKICTQCSNETIQETHIVMRLVTK